MSGSPIEVLVTRSHTRTVPSTPPVTATARPSRWTQATAVTAPVAPVTVAPDVPLTWLPVAHRGCHGDWRESHRDPSDTRSTTFPRCADARCSRSPLLVDGNGPVHRDVAARLDYPVAAGLAATGHRPCGAGTPPVLRRRVGQSLAGCPSVHLTARPTHPVGSIHSFDAATAYLMLPLCTIRPLASPR